MEEDRRGPQKKGRQDRLLPIVLSVGKGSGTFFFFSWESRALLLHQGEAEERL